MLLLVGCWLLLVVRSLIVDVGCSLFVVCCLLCVVFFVVVVCCSLFVIVSCRLLSFGVCCVVFAVC